MNRRNFIGQIVGGVAVVAAVRSWPFRVYSFPKEIEYPFDGIRAWIIGPGSISFPDTVIPFWMPNMIPESEDRTRGLKENWLRAIEGAGYRKVVREPLPRS